MLRELDGGVTIERDAEGNVYARQGGDTIGEIINYGDEVNANVLPEARGAGVATAMVAEFIRANPVFNAGSLTAGGEAAVRAAFRQLQSERGEVLNQSARFSEDNRLSNLNPSGPSWERIRAANPALAKTSAPDDTVTVYRATVGDSIRPDDFVAVDRAVAEMELENVVDRDGNGARIIEQQVRVRDLLMGNDATEFVYAPEVLNQSSRKTP